MPATIIITKEQKDAGWLEFHHAGNIKHEFVVVRDLGNGTFQVEDPGIAEPGKGLSPL